MSSRSCLLDPYAVIPQFSAPVLDDCRPPVLRALRKRSYTLTLELPESAMLLVFILPNLPTVAPSVCSSVSGPLQDPSMGGQHG